MTIYRAKLQKKKDFGIDGPAYPHGIITSNAETLWKRGYVGRNVNVAVLDSGIDSNHPDLHGKVVYRKTYYGAPKDGHGTHVAGTIAGEPNKSKGMGIHGMAPKVSLYDIQVLDEGNGSEAVFVKGFKLAVDLNVDVINMSLGSDKKIPYFYPLLKQAHAKGIIVVCASGNSGHGKLLYPAIYEECVSVTNFDIMKDEYNRSSNTNKYVDICAPGTDVLSCELNGNYAVYTGTSMATPHVSGMCALLLEKYRRSDPGLSKTQLREKVVRSLYRNVVDYPPKGVDHFYGHGVMAYGRKQVRPEDVKSLAYNKYYCIK